MPDLGDMGLKEFDNGGRAIVEWTAGEFAGGDRYRVLAQVAPDEIRSVLERRAPERGVPILEMFANCDRILVPGVTHWNQPGTMAYSPSSGSGPGVLAEFLTASLNQHAM